jgi:hypothetical protein
LAQAGIIGEKEFARLITTQDSFSASDMQTIERLIARYPYCQAFHYIYTAALKRARSEDFDALVQRSAAFSPDRASLFRYIEKPRELRAFLNPPAESNFGTAETPNETVYNNNIAPVLVEEKSIDKDEDEIVEAQLDDVPSSEILSTPFVDDQQVEAELSETETGQCLEPDEQAETDAVFTEISEAGTLGFLANTLPEEDDEQQDQSESEDDDTLSHSQDIDSPDEDLEKVAHAEDDFENQPDLDEAAEVVSIGEHTESLESSVTTETSDSISSKETVENDGGQDQAEDDVFEEIGEVPFVEGSLPTELSVSADVEEEAWAEEEVEVNADAAEPVNVSVSDEIETEIPSIENPVEEFAKPSIVFEENEESDFTDIPLTLNTNQVTPVVAAISVADLGIDIETVVPDLDLPDFGKDLRDNPIEITDSDKDSDKFHVEQVAEYSEQIETVTPPDYPEERLMLDSVAARDYFVFDRSVVDPLGTSSRENSEHEPLPAVPEANIVVKPEVPVVSETETMPEKEAEDVSKYHDDTLPFSFLWWLHKTRKEYDSTYQPYISKPNISSTVSSAPANADLNQQIIESIFHAQPELNTFPEHASVTYSISPKKREGDLIERFIKEEPHIKPPASDNLNTENKAKRSSEDSLDLVSETLAKIYIDQMLFHKAIDTYKKLSLKFPEKSTYFADQISDLQKKIN